MRRKLLGKVAHKASLITQQEDVADSWRTLLESVEALVKGGLPPSDVRLREALWQVIDEAPESAQQYEGFQRVLDEVDRYLETRTERHEAAPPQPTEDVLKARELLNGKAMLIIGGERRRSACERLKEQFGLAEVHWFNTRVHQSIARFRPYVRRPEVVLVAQLISHSDHGFGDLIKDCRKHNTCFVRLTGGYNPARVAVDIVGQCSEQLREGAA